LNSANPFGKDRSVKFPEFGKCANLCYPVGNRFQRQHGSL
jgi:hypothetical protein